jgi:hypothetical protein
MRVSGFCQHQVYSTLSRYVRCHYDCIMERNPPKVPRCPTSPTHCHMGPTLLRTKHKSPTLTDAWPHQAPFVFSLSSCSSRSRRTQKAEREREEAVRPGREGKGNRCGICWPPRRSPCADGGKTSTSRRSGRTQPSSPSQPHTPSSPQSHWSVRISLSFFFLSIPFLFLRWDGGRLLALPPLLCCQIFNCPLLHRAPLPLLSSPCRFSSLGSSAGCPSSDGQRRRSSTS